ncbi:hypothetical protein SVIOM74S_04197 [Streptomyces violarus]
MWRPRGRRTGSTASTWCSAGANCPACGRASPIGHPPRPTIRSWAAGGRRWPEPSRSTYPRSCPTTWCPACSWSSTNCRSHPNGKVDKRALPAPDEADVTKERCVARRPRHSARCADRRRRPRSHPGRTPGQLLRSRRALLARDPAHSADQEGDRRRTAAPADLQRGHRRRDVRRPGAARGAGERTVGPGRPARGRRGRGAGSGTHHAPTARTVVPQPAGTPGNGARQRPTGVPHRRPSGPRGLRARREGTGGTARGAAHRLCPARRHGDPARPSRRRLRAAAGGRRGGGSHGVAACRTAAPLRAGGPVRDPRTPAHRVRRSAHRGADPALGRLRRLVRERRTRGAARAVPRAQPGEGTGASAASPVVRQGSPAGRRSRPTPRNSPGRRTTGDGNWPGCRPARRCVPTTNDARSRRTRARPWISGSPPNYWKPCAG